MSLLITRAFEFASHKHREQKRKGKFEFPYLSHIATVATLLARFNCEEEVIIAGILHDTLEDTDTTYEELVLQFGKQVADLVQHVSENKSLSYLERKLDYINHLELPETPNAAAMISCADLIANTYSLLLEEDITAGIVMATHDFSSKRIEGDFYEQVTKRRRDVIAKKVGEHHPLVVELDSVLENVFELVEGTKKEL